MGAKVFVLLAAMVAFGCGASPSGPSGGTETLSVKIDRDGFQILADLAPDALIRDIADRLISERPRQMADLTVSEAGTIRVLVYQDQASWDQALFAYFGQRLSATGYITGPFELRLLATSQVRVAATHELAHALSLRLNPGFANNPRWLWEAAALWENGEFVDPRTLSYMTGGQPPTLSSLNADVNASRQIYEVGYTLMEFVHARFGHERYLELIRRNGDTTSALGLTATQFEQGWYAFVRERYPF